MTRETPQTRVISLTCVSSEIHKLQAVFLRIYRASGRVREKMENSAENFAK